VPFVSSWFALTGSGFKLDRALRRAGAVDRVEPFRRRRLFGPVGQLDCQLPVRQPLPQQAERDVHDPLALW
jgi:hypothetical protein